MTGAGRSTAAKELEDLGYFVVDNLPPELVGDVVRLVDEKQGVDQPVAAVVDVRAGVFFDVAARAARREVPDPAHDAALPRGRRRHPGAAPGGRPATAPAAGLRPAARGHRPGAGGDGQPARRRRPGHRHHLAQRPPAQGQGRRGVRHARDGEAADHRGQLRLQVRRPGRRRPDGRHAVPAEPALGARAASPDRQGRRRGGVRQGPGRRPGVPRALRAGDRDRRRRLPARGQALHDRGHRLHRRQAPQRGDVRGDRQPAARRRARGRGHPPRPGPGVAGRCAGRPSPRSSPSVAGTGSRRR